MIGASRQRSGAIFQGRERALFFGLVALIGVILVRLFYWQILESDRLQAQANDQYERNFTSTGRRGTMTTADGYTLVSNQVVYRLFAQPPKLSLPPKDVAMQLAPYLLPGFLNNQAASDAASLQNGLGTLTQQLTDKLSNPKSKWVSLATSISEEDKQKITDLHLQGVGFDSYEKRYYPEASMAAQLTGFVGKDDDGNDIGYFGIEGALEQELKGRSQKTTIMADALGLPLPSEEEQKKLTLDGRDITLTIRRDVQRLIESKLAWGIEHYGAESGEVIVIEPKTGNILGMTAWPSFDQSSFYKFDPATYANPSLTSIYEPGSTFKTLTISAGIDAGVITPDTQCDKCSGPRVFGQYTIRTWNDKYAPGITMTDALAKSDNTAMIFVAERLGADKLKQYLQNFGIGEPLHIELQGDRKTPFPKQWGPVELATISFGQGIDTTSLQLARAVGTIANGGLMMRPRIIQSVKDITTGETIVPDPVEERRVISEKTAKTVAQMMITSAAHGEAQWTASKTHWVAAKTGTAQVSVNGKYDPDKTIASYVGFAPPENAQFLMIVKLVAPKTSIWAAETAAPLWYNIASDLFLLFNMPPDRAPDAQPAGVTPVGD